MEKIGGWRSIEMPEGQSEESFCDLRMMLFRYGGVNTTYDAKGGIKRSFVLSGRIDDPDLGPGSGPDFSAPHFHNKPVRLEISSPPDPEWLGTVCTARGVDEACGLVRVNAGVEPKRYEVDGEMIEEEAVKVILAVNDDAFEAIRSQASEAYDHRRIMQAKVTLIGESLPETDDPTSPFGLDLADLDVSTVQGYAVRGFEIFDTRYFDHLRSRVLQVERGRDEGYGAYISILLTEARYEVYVERALVHSISCEGRVINHRGKPYDGADVTIEFAEHEPNRYDELPERAFFGEFGYYPKLPDEKHSSTHFTFHLRYVPEDARNLLIPLLTQETETRVILTVNLANEEEELLAATDKLRGNVRHYSFEVRQHLVNDSP
jgi:hypothetical protein